MLRVLWSSTFRNHFSWNLTRLFSLLKAPRNPTIKIFAQLCLTQPFSELFSHEILFLLTLVISPEAPGAPLSWLPYKCSLGIPYSHPHPKLWAWVFMIPSLCIVTVGLLENFLHSNTVSGKLSQECRRGFTKLLGGSRKLQAKCGWFPNLHWHCLIPLWIMAHLLCTIWVCRSFFPACLLPKFSQKVLGDEEVEGYR